MVTVTLAGLAATSVVPAGRLAVTGTSWTPALRPVTSRSTTRAEADSRSRSAVEPPMVTRTRSTDRAYVRSLLAPTRRRPALNVRVAVTGRSVIVTVIVSSPTATTPVGSARPTSTVSSAETPVIGIGSVST